MIVLLWCKFISGGWHREIYTNQIVCNDVELHWYHAALAFLIIYKLIKKFNDIYTYDATKEDLKQMVSYSPYYEEENHSIIEQIDFEVGDTIFISTRGGTRTGKANQRISISRIRYE